MCVCVASRQDNHVSVCVCVCVCAASRQDNHVSVCVCARARTASRHDNHVNEPTNQPTNRLRAVNTPV